VCVLRGKLLRSPEGRGYFRNVREAEVRRALEGALGDRLGRVVVREAMASTSSELDPTWPDWSVAVTDHQTAGRGRVGRVWVTPPGEALTFSVLLRPGVGAESFGWLPLLAGLAVAGVLGELGVDARLKWPNDVLVAAGEELPGWGRWRKVCGVLGERTGDAAVLGIGVNVSQTELPVPTATSLRLAGARVGRAELLESIVARLGELDAQFRAHAGDATASGLAQACAAACLSVGSQVRVSLPGGQVLQGRATGLGPDGSLQVSEPDGTVHSVLAGDVEHVRF
jgi:BirA family transcriptional regulator, biotin operon repressor / biotin---[acetyl-CoA-carboxylase] ligase